MKDNAQRLPARWPLPRSEQCCRNCSASRPNGADGIFCLEGPPAIFPLPMCPYCKDRVADYGFHMQVRHPEAIEPIKEPLLIFHSQFPAMKEQGWCRRWAPKEPDA